MNTVRDRARRTFAAALVMTLAIAPTMAGSATRSGAKTPATRTAEPKTGVVSAAVDSVHPDFSGYQGLLDEFLTVTSDPGAPLETRFDYWDLNHQDGMRPRLGRIRQSLLAIPPSRMSDKTRLAWAINTYNFVVIQLVAENLFADPTNSYWQGKPAVIRRLRKSVQEIAFDYGSFFEAPKIVVEGTDYSLDRFEKHFLFADYDRSTKAPPPRSLDARIHFALVCGAKGCPPLQPRAYQPDSIDLQLDLATRSALSSPAHLKMEPSNGSLAVSTIFSWYETDFGGQPGVIAFLKRNAPANVRAEIEKRKPKWVNSYIPWDWALNQTPDKGS